MSKIIHRQGDLFAQSLEGLYLAHACNCKGIWGAGMAREFAKRFPKAHQQYQERCLESSFYNIGSAGVFPDGAVRVVCLYTSSSYGDEKDSEARILRATKLALRDFWMQLPEGAHVHSPKFNSGLFAVPWAKTEAVLEEALSARPDVEWIVWEQS